MKLLAGTFSSSLCLPASEVAARNNIVYWEVSCVDPRFNARGYKNVFRTEIDANGFGWYEIEFLRDTLHQKLGNELKDLKVAFLSEDSAYGQGTTEAGKKRAQELGIPIVSVDFYNRNTHDRLHAHHSQAQVAPSRMSSSRRATRTTRSCSGSKPSSSICR